MLRVSEHAGHPFRSGRPDRSPWGRGQGQHRGETGRGGRFGPKQVADMTEIRNHANCTVRRLASARPTAPQRTAPWHHAICRCAPGTWGERSRGQGSGGQVARTACVGSIFERAAKG